MAHNRERSDSEDERELVQRGYRYALSLSHSPSDAEDLVQSACAKLFELRGMLGPASYLFTTIRNLFYDGTRRNKILEFTSLDSEISDGGAAPEVSPTSGAGQDIEKLLRTLRPDEREVIYLQAVEGYSAREIGDLTGRPRNTVLSLLHRARAKMTAAVSGGVTGSAREGAS